MTFFTKEPNPSETKRCLIKLWRNYKLKSPVNTLRVKHNNFKLKKSAGWQSHWLYHEQFSALNLTMNTIQPCVSLSNSSKKTWKETWSLILYSGGLVMFAENCSLCVNFEGFIQPLSRYNLQTRGWKTQDKLLPRQ